MAKHTPLNRKRIKAPSELEKEIGGRFKDIRIANKETQEEMAEKLGKSVQTIHNYEKGITKLPYVVITTEQGKVFHEYTQNEKKHDMRGIRHHDMFGYEEGLTEYLNSVFSKYEPEDAVVNKMRYEALVAAIDLLPDKQRRRCKMYFLMELTVDEIAEIEGITYQKVSESIIKAKGNLEKILKKIKFF